MVEKLRQEFDKIPWGSFGRQTAISALSRSVLPVGNFATRLPHSEEQTRQVALGDPDYESSLMDIVGTGIQVGRGKILTCWHVCEHLRVREGLAYLQATTQRDDVWYKTYWPVIRTINFLDPRIMAGNPDVDVGMLICPAVQSQGIDYGVPPVAWGDSTNLGVGDRVLIGGYPLGTVMFLTTQTNRGLIQPTFYDGVVSAIIPAVKSTETRLLQLSTVALGGISGGVVCDPESGAVLGMVTSGLECAGIAAPITYAIPSEVLAPWSSAINFKAGSKPGDNREKARRLLAS